MKAAAAPPTILLIGTYDTKDAELRYLEEVIRAAGGEPLSMDVSVLRGPEGACDVSRHDVAAAAGMDIDSVIALNSEARAFDVMSRGAASEVARLYGEGRVQGMLSLGGTMGTDLALDCAMALPLGIPKYIVSTVAFSPIIPANRIFPDVQMILWAGGLYGINSLCRSVLRQAGGAVVGAAQMAEPPDLDRPMVGMTSLGASCLRYMKPLKPALEARGFEVAVFHSQGMGGMAFERLASQGHFACVMDFCMQELVNMLAGSVVSSGPDRLTGAGRAGVPQMVAPGVLDLVDFASWQELPARFADRPRHVHNRLITSAVFTADEQAESLEEMARRLESATGPVTLMLPNKGLQEWDRPGEDAHDPASLAKVIAAARRIFAGRVPLREVDAHINDAAFAEAVLDQFDTWVAEGVITTPDTPAKQEGTA